MEETNEGNGQTTLPPNEDVELLDLNGGKGKKQTGFDNGDMAQNSRYCTTVLLVTIICTVPMINYDLTALNPTIPVLKQMYNETIYARHATYMNEGQWSLLEALTMSMIVAGCFIGSISLKIVLTFLSRKQCMVAIHIINIVGALIASAAGGMSKAYEAIIIGRFVMGLANGLALGVVPVIIGETCVKHRCAFYDGLIGVCLAVGSLFGVIMGWSQVFGTAQLWPLIIVTAAVPSVVYLAISPWISNTPFYLMTHGVRSEVEAAIQKLRDGPESVIKEEFNNIVGARADKQDALLDNAYDESSDTATRKDATLTDVIKSPHYRRQFIMVLLLFANLMLNGLNNVLFFSDKIFESAGIPHDYVTVVTVCVFLFQVVATLPGSVILHRFGSWKLCIIGNIIMIVGHILVVASLATYESVPAMSYLAIGGIAVYLLGFAGGENIALFPLVGELTTEMTRPICVNFGCATLWFTGWLVGFMSSYFMDWLHAYAFLIWMGFTIIFTIYIAVFVPNTSKMTSEEIQARFKR